MHVLEKLPPRKYQPLDEVLEWIASKAYYGCILSRVNTKCAIRDVEGKSSIDVAVVVLGLLPEYSQSFTGDLKRDRVLVRDLIEPIHGIGEKKAKAIYERCGVDKNAELTELSEGQLTDLRAVLDQFRFSFIA